MRMCRQSSWTLEHWGQELPEELLVPWNGDFLLRSSRWNLISKCFVLLVKEAESC